MGSLPPVTMRTRDLALTLATSTLLLVGLTGCSDDPPPSPAASPSESSGSAGSAEPSPSESAEPTEPAVEPATGPVVSTPAGSLRVPEKWTTTGSELFTDAERAPDRGRDITKDVYGFIGVDAETAESMTLDEAAREAGRMTTTDGKRVADAELDGEPVFVHHGEHRLRQHRVHHRRLARRAPGRHRHRAARRGEEGPHRARRVGARQLAVEVTGPATTGATVT